MHKKLMVLFVSIFLIHSMVACNNMDEGTLTEENELPQAQDNGVGETTLAGSVQEEFSGEIKEVLEASKIVIVVDGEEVTYILSADAKSQLEQEEFAVGDSVHFATYSSGSHLLTIDKFQK